MAAKYDSDTYRSFRRPADDSETFEHDGLPARGRPRSQGGEPCEKSQSDISNESGDKWSINVSVEGARALERKAILFIIVAGAGMVGGLVMLYLALR